MRINGVIALACLLVACGDKEDRGPDLKKMAPEEACATVSRKIYECRATIVESLRPDLEQAGASADDIAQLAKAFERPPSGCDDATRGEVEQIAGCFSNDCGKLAACVKPLMLDATRAMGGDTPAPSGGPAGSTASP